MEQHEAATKLLLDTLDTACQTKRELTTEFGIGEKAPLTLFAWLEGKLVLIAQCTPGLDRQEQIRYEVVCNAAFIIRRKLGCDAFSLAVEGYRCKERTEVPLEQRFAEGDPEVHECIAVWVSTPGLGLVSTTPFTYGVPRTVTYGPTSVEKLGEGGAYHDTLQIVFTKPQDLSAPLSVPHLEAMGLKVSLA